MKFKRVVSYGLIAIMLCVFPLVEVSAEVDVRYEEEADFLKAVGLFKGTNNGYELEREATRVEALVMMIRLIGYESEALVFTGSHPFTDVPSWAESYVAYAYDAGLTNGISDSEFGSNDTVTSYQYMTFVLRAMGVESVNPGFDYRDSINEAYNEGIISSEDWQRYNDGSVILRDDCVGMAYKALDGYVYGTSKTLGSQLIDKGAIEAGKEYMIEDAFTKASKVTDGYLVGYSEVDSEYFSVKIKDLAICFPEAVGYSEFTVLSELVDKGIQSDIIMDFISYYPMGDHTIYPMNKWEEILVAKDSNRVLDVEKTSDTGEAVYVVSDYTETQGFILYDNANNIIGYYLSDGELEDAGIVVVQQEIDMTERYELVESVIGNKVSQFSEVKNFSTESTDTIVNGKQVYGVSIYEAVDGLDFDQVLVNIIADMEVNYVADGDMMRPGISRIIKYNADSVTSKKLVEYSVNSSGIVEYIISEFGY